MEANKKAGIREFIDRYALVYEKAAQKWEEHIPMGNGFIGAALWGDNPINITLDRYDVWETRNTYQPKRDKYNYEYLRKLVSENNEEEVHKFFEPGIYYGDKFGKHGEVYPTKLPMGRVEIEFEGNIRSYNAKLDIYDGISTGNMEFDGSNVEWKIYVHALRNIIIADLTLKNGAKIKKFIGKQIENNESLKLLKQWDYSEPEVGLCGSFEYIKQALPDNSGYVVMWGSEKCCHSHKPDEERIVLYTTICFNESNDPVIYACDLIKSAMDTGIESFEEEHVKWWNSYWERSLITIQDSRLDALYYMEMYKIGSLTRPGGFPINLQGLWTKDGAMPPWSGEYACNINIQETYWPIYAGNCLELGKPLYDWLFNNMHILEKNCKEFFGIHNALFLPAAVTLDMVEANGWHTVQLWPGVMPWLSHHFWLHYLYSQDRVFLRDKAYPVMKKSMALYAGLVEKDDNGKFHIPMSYNPEWKDNSLKAWGRDTSCDLALIRFLCKALLEIVDILEIEDTDIEKWKDILENMADFPEYSDSTGFKQGLSLMEDMPLSESHRHFSHLMAIYPLGVLNIEGSKDERELIERSIFNWHSKGKGEWVGWSYPWASLIYSRLGNGNAAYHHLKEYMDGFIMYNTQHINGNPKGFGICVWDYSPMTLEGGFGAAAAITETLLQSWGGKIRVFPSIPDVWYEAAFKDLRAEGAFIVSSKMEDKVVKYIKVKSEAGVPCRVTNPFKDERCRLMEKDSNEIKVYAGREILFDTQKGREYYLLPDDGCFNSTDMEEFTPLEIKKEDKNPFGVKLRPRW